tara:strand:- start:153 stop:311 length:159 start_codon:yes stop_codon:yes gene_type:complete
MTKEWFNEEEKKWLKAIFGFGKKAVVATAVIATGTVGLGLLSVIEDADYPLE